MKRLADTPPLEAAAIGLAALLVCLVAGALAVVTGERDMWTGKQGAWKVFSSYALPVGVNAGTMHWPSLAATLILLHLHWQGKFAHARVVFILALVGALAARAIAGRHQYEMFVFGDALVGIAITSRRPRATA